MATVSYRDCELLHGNCYTLAHITLCKIIADCSGSYCASINQQQ